MGDFKYVIVGILLVITAVVVAFWVGVIGQVATTPAALVSKTIDADNIIYNYEWFYDTNAAVEAKHGQIKTHKTLISESAGDEKRMLNIELAAMRQSCRELVTRYNANATKVNRSIFRGREAPQNISISACEE